MEPFIDSQELEFCKASSSWTGASGNRRVQVCMRYTAPVLRSTNPAGWLWAAVKMSGMASSCMIACRLYKEHLKQQAARRTLPAPEPKDAS